MRDRLLHAIVENAEALGAQAFQCTAPAGDDTDGHGDNTGLDAELEPRRLTRPKRRE